MAKRLKLFGDYIFSRENRVQTFSFRVHWLSEFRELGDFSGKMMVKKPYFRGGGVALHP